MKYLPIAFIADKNFFLPTVVAMTSLLENKSHGSIYVIYIVCVGFTEEQISIIKNVEEKYKTRINIVEIEESSLREKYRGLNKHDCNATLSALIKFDLPDICSEEETLLYLDGDIIVKDDLASILSFELKEDIYVAAVRDSGILYSKRLVRQENPNYFNSGVMYLNLKAMRRDGLSQKLVEAKMNSMDNSLMDQHVLNEVLGKKVSLLDYKYNTLYVNLRRAHYFHKLSLNDINGFCKQEYSSWTDILDQAIILHYSSFDKPWKYVDVYGVELWDKYYKLSNLRDMRLERKKLYTNTVERIMKHKILRPIGILIWELNTKGVIKSAKEAFGFLKTKK